MKLKLDQASKNGNRMNERAKWMEFIVNSEAKQ